ncbi:MAG: hypothetical protein RLZZ387_620 [Chloroflexota bacterium]|jgi:HSP20 family protein
MPTEIERRTPFREMMALRDRVDRLIESALARPRGEWFATIFDYPALDMYETDDQIKIDVPLPGMKPEEVEVTVTGDVLTIKGERRAKEEVKDEHYYYRETHYGAYTRTVTLPETAEKEHPEATCADGVLTVTFPKVTPKETKRVEVKSAEPHDVPVAG